MRAATHDAARTVTSGLTLRGDELELLPGEKDNVNLRYIEELASALDDIQNHPAFANVASAAPLKVTRNAKESGTQSPFNASECEVALKTPLQSYTAGFNLFWIDWHWSATPGVPRSEEHTSELQSH